MTLASTQDTKSEVLSQSQQDMTYRDALEFLSTNRPMLPVGLRSFSERFIGHFIALLLRRFAMIRRDTVAFLIQVVAPALALAATLALCA